MTDLGAVPATPWRPMSTRTTARTSVQSGTWPSSSGLLQVDGYNGFKALADARADASVTLAFCWSHMRRYFYDEFVSTKSPLAAEVLVRVRTLYAIEAEIRGHPAEHRRAGSPGTKSPDCGSALRLAAGPGQASVRPVRPGQSHALRDPALAGAGRVSRRRPGRDGYQRG